MPISDADERDLKVAVMQADLVLKERQAFWETPRNLAIVVSAAAAIVGLLAGVLGYKIGQKETSQQMPNVTVYISPGTYTAAPLGKVEK
jgi:hypothetical protein